MYMSQLPQLDSMRARIDAAYLSDETAIIAELLSAWSINEKSKKRIVKAAATLINSVRNSPQANKGIAAFMQSYSLDCEEGVLLMCLAEALMRIPDKKTSFKLVKDKLTQGDWENEIAGVSVKSASLGLRLSSKLLSTGNNYVTSLFKRLVSHLGEPVIMQAVKTAMNMLGNHFVLGETIAQALKNSQQLAKQGYRFSFDMLGEVARTQADANRYFESYKNAIQTLGDLCHAENMYENPGISVKLSALHPRFEFSQREFVVPILIERMRELSVLAMKSNMHLAIDAEEADRLDLTLDVFEGILGDPALLGWAGLGLVVQAYQKRALSVIDWVIKLANRYHKIIPVRLVKGAYWDTEIKLSQINGEISYPVFTAKAATDLNYLVCSKKMIAAKGEIFPQFATHNAYTIAAVCEMLGARDHNSYEFQLLQGMGQQVYNHIIKEKSIKCRIYAPIGVHEDLLPYLVRRLLENGANSSFVNRLADESISIAELSEDPAEILTKQKITKYQLPLPADLYQPGRINSKGMSWSHYSDLAELSLGLGHAKQKKWQAKPTVMIQSKLINKKIYHPADSAWQVGEVHIADRGVCEATLTAAVNALATWIAVPVETRVEFLNAAANALERHSAELVYLIAAEGGRTLQDAYADLREAIDFCRYYAEQALLSLAKRELPGPTGESNELFTEGRGVALCISPWNFPAAIFTGQMCSALVAGNTVIAKPALLTPLTAARIVDIFHEIGIAKDVLQLLPATGTMTGDVVVADSRVSLVMLTGSNNTAKTINTQLAQSHEKSIPFIAETGGINVMVVDSSALPEQCVADVVYSAFNSAGQRCSALRILCVQDDIADDIITMLQGAMAELRVGSPFDLATDVSSVIDKKAFDDITGYLSKLEKNFSCLAKTVLPEGLKDGYFIAPQLYEVGSVQDVQREVFGPVLHLVRYKVDQMENLVDEINQLNFGLTFGIHSRIDDAIEYFKSRIRAGNIYVNREITGAVVGVQPFGGMNLSGTGPKAGGPNYLSRLCYEKTVTVNTAAVGGNASLMVLDL